MKPSYQARIQGFTLIELMIIVMVIGILAAIALPSYRQYYVRNTQEQAKDEMMSIANQLASWRSKTLSYRGFIPANICNSVAGNCYSGTGSQQVYVPLGSNSTNYRYVITLLDASPSATGSASTGATDYSRTTAVSLTDSTAIGNGWRMTADPNSTNSLVSSSPTYYYDSTGQRCAYQQAVISGLVLSANTVSCTGTGISSW